VKLRKATISFVMSVRLSITPSVRMVKKKLSFQWTDFSWNLIFENFSKIFRKKWRFFKNLTRITGTLHGDLCPFMIASCSFLLRTWKLFRQKLYRKWKHTFWVLQLFFPKNHPIYEIMWEKTLLIKTDRRWKYNAVHALCMGDN